MIDMQEQETDVYYITLTLSNVQSTDAGIYRLVIVNQFGEVTVEISLVVNGKLQFFVRLYITLYM